MVYSSRTKDIMQRTRSTARFVLAALAVVAVVAHVSATSTSAAQSTTGDAALVQALRAGGLVLVMRHASSPRDLPTPQTAKPGNTKLERQLDDAGVRGATAVGEALRALRVPITRLLSSPTYRTLETVRVAKLTGVTAAEELGDNGGSMAGITEAQAEWLRAQAAMAPRTGNTLLVTHQPNVALAFPTWGEVVAEGEMVALRPDGRGGSSVVGRIRVEDWARLRAGQ
jgi:phosphohistidine phosphatase SixA